MTAAGGVILGKDGLVVMGLVFIGVGIMTVYAGARFELSGLDSLGRIVLSGVGVGFVVVGFFVTRYWWQWHKANRTGTDAITN